MQREGQAGEVFYAEKRPFGPPKRVGFQPEKSEVVGRARGPAWRIANDPAKTDKARAAAYQTIYKAAMREVPGRDFYRGWEEPLFRYATLSSHAGQHVDRADDFFAGRFQSYYCPGSPSVWPNAASLAVPGMREALAELGDASNFQNWFAYLRALSQAP